MTPAVQGVTMQGCDFFSFCTSLKRPELKAIGELSWVRHMAKGLIKARELAVSQHHALELSGRISTFDLTTIHQTVINSGQTGELKIKDENAETIGAFYFESGQLSAGQFEHLTGDEAFWQLFLIETLSGTFSFAAVEKPLTEWIQSARMTPISGDHLIVALQYR